MQDFEEWTQKCSQQYENKKIYFLKRLVLLLKVDQTSFLLLCLLRGWKVQDYSWELLGSDDIWGR